MNNIYQYHGTTDDLQHFQAHSTTNICHSQDSSVDTTKVTSFSINIGIWVIAVPNTLHILCGYITTGISNLYILSGIKVFDHGTSVIYHTVRFSG